jgi:uncharacterized protein YdeI (YjbR/CyaY-like superfamily)
MKNFKTLYVSSREEWRKWLISNHKPENEIWLIYFKKHTGRPRIAYNDAVEEAICFGWIDSTIRKIDDDRYMQKFTPRNKNSFWSKANIERMKKMINEGKVTEAGLFKINPSLLTKVQVPFERVTTFSADIEEMLNFNTMARHNFDKLPPSHKKRYIMYIMEAKREETRLKRLNESIQMLARNERLGMK